MAVIRLFYDYLVEEGVRERNPVRYGALGVGGLVPRYRKLPWIQNDEQRQAVLEAARREPMRNRVMLAMSYGIPINDVRGRITSHRARSTIASQLFNAKEPMTLFELEEWLGHSSPEATSALSEDHPDQAGKVVC